MPHEGVIASVVHGLVGRHRRVWHITGMWREAEGDVPAPGPVREYARAAVAEREAHRQRRDFAAADRVAVELLRRGVEVDDRAKAWAYRPWRPAPEESGEVVPATAASVEALLIERDGQGRLRACSCWSCASQAMGS